MSKEQEVSKEEKSEKAKHPLKEIKALRLDDDELDKIAGGSGVINDGPGRVGVISGKLKWDSR